MIIDLFVWYDTNEFVSNNTNNINKDLSDEWKGKVIGGAFNPISEADIKLMICSQIVHKIRSYVILIIYKTSNTTSPCIFVF